MLKYVHVDRTCTHLKRTSDADEFNLESRPIKDYRNNNAFVLLGGPGAGKSKVFRYESDNTDNGLYITARNFLTFDCKPEWRTKTLFIDGLDEVRVGQSNSQMPFDAIRSKIDRLGKPPFRLSCRNAYWYGSIDRDLLENVSPTGDVAILTLDPLTKDNISTILRHQSKIDISQDIDSIIDDVVGIGELVKIPLMLKLISATKFTADDQANRADIFSRACKFLIDESNPQHATAIQRNVENSFDLAGKICALALLSGCIGFSLDPNESDCNFLSLKNIPQINHAEFRQILDSKLFVPQSENRFISVHWQFVEFLAANHVALKIAQGLPVKRVLSLISGNDQGIVMEMRGFSTWLATQSKCARSTIIQHNPLDILLNGDVKHFSNDEKHLVLKYLKNFVEENSFPGFLASELQINDLITQETVDVIRQYLESIELLGKAGTFELFLLRMLSNGTDISEIFNVLIEIVRNNNVQTGARELALKAICKNQGEDSGNTNKLQLLMLLKDVFSEGVTDPSDDLLGLLLNKFYPEDLSVAQAFHYLRPRKVPHYFGSYYEFWTACFCSKSSFEQLIEALNMVGQQRSHSASTAELNPEKSERIFTVLPLIILEKLLNEFSDKLGIEQLFDFLGIASGADDMEHHIGIGTLHRENIGKWLQNHTETHLEIIAKGVKRCADQSNPSNPHQFNHCVYFSVERRTFSAKPQSDFGLWCLNQAKAANDPLVAEYYIQKVSKFLCDEIFNEGLSTELSTELVLHQLANKPILREQFEKNRAELYKIRSKESSWKHQHSRKLAEINQDVCEYITSNRSELIEKRGEASFLHFSANVYFGKHVDFQQINPHQRIGALLKNNAESVKILLEGFRKTIDRNDVPDMEEILRLRARHDSHQLLLPFLAGVVEHIGGGQTVNGIFSDKRLKTAITIYVIERASLLYFGNSELLSNWFASLLKSHPKLVAEILVRCNLTELHVAGRYGFMVYELSSDRSYSNVAKFASLPLLEAFPLRTKREQLIDLGLLLKAAITNCETEEFLILLAKKLSYNSMTLAQRSYWLAAGILVNPDFFCLRLKSYVNQNERRVRFLANAVRELFTEPELSNFNSTEVLAILIESIGHSFGPQFLSGEIEENNKLFAYSNSAVNVQCLIYRLSLIPTEAACIQLQELASNDKLTAWQPFIDAAVKKQKTLYREASFNYESVDTIQRVLNNLEPANSRDLAAMVIDHIDNLNNKIRNSATSDWRQYWNVDSNGQPSNPKPEPVCRDAWLSDLRALLEPSDIDAQREGAHANDNRSDIRISYRDFCIPVEIKHSRSLDLWIACRNQQIEKYVAPELGADGYGVYLVFWFGEHYLKNSPDGIELPTTANQLAVALRSQLSEEEQGKIYIRVVDVSDPRK